MSAARTPVALVLGLSPTGLIPIRSLGRRGVDVFGADLTPWGIAGFSRYCTYVPELFEASQRRDGELLCEALVEFAERQDAKPVLFATNDTYIELLAPHFERLRDHYLCSTDLTDHGTTFLNKRSFYDLCAEQGVELPATFFPQSDEDVRSVAEQIRYPAIIKPAYVHRFHTTLKGKKVVQVLDAKELLEGYRRLARVDRNLIVQEVIPGPDSQIYVSACYLDSGSRMRALFVGRKIRQYPPRFGSASLAESVWDPEVARLSARFLENVGFRGICGVEYKRDPRDSRLKMIEVNPRLTLWMGLPYATGVDIAGIAYDDVTGRVPEHGTQVNGVRWTYLVRDLQSSLYYLVKRQLSLSAWWQSLRGCTEEAIWAWDDVKVGLYIPAYAAARVLRRWT